jgi:hypothetical protein
VQHVIGSPWRRDEDLKRRPCAAAKEFSFLTGPDASRATRQQLREIIVPAVAQKPAGASEETLSSEWIFEGFAIHGLPG